MRYRKTTIKSVFSPDIIQSVITSGEAGRGCSLASLSVVLLSLSLSEQELLSDPLWLLESSLECAAPSLLVLLHTGKSAALFCGQMAYRTLP